LGFPQIKYFRHGWRVLTGKYVKEDTEGDTTPFQALTTALSGTVGTGNIGGVALAIFLGGPAAIFWMWVTAFLGMTTKFVEVTLSHKYREKLPDGSMSGGPMYYIENGLNMKWLAVVFSVCLLLMCLGTGNMPQISSISVVLLDTFNIPKIATGLVLSVLVWLVIIGGIKRIAQIASKLVPFMAFWYIVGGLAVIISNYENIIPSFQSIFVHVFTPTAAVGGFLGASVAAALTRGVNRGLYSNEAGQGSAPIAHASSKTENPIEEGMVSILEPFIDTIIICTLTGLVILSSGVWNQKFDNKFEASAMVFVEGKFVETNQEDASELRNYYYGNNSEIEYTGPIEVINGKINLEKVTLLHNRSIAENTIVYFSEDNSLYSGSLDIKNGSIKNTGDYTLRGNSLLLGADLTGKAFTKSVFGDFGQYIVAIGLLLFAFSTVIAWSYYGDRATVHLFGEGWVFWYRVVYVAAFFTASIIDTKIVWDIATVIGPIATVPNLLALILLRKEIKKIDSEYVIKT
jgi:AGCS family alanine or glycine:cation symporter